MKVRVFCLLLLISLISAQKVVKDIPVIGILSKPLENETHSIETNLTQVIDVPYVLYLSGSGARVVQISHKLNDEELREIMNKINGIFFTGGGSDFVWYDENTKQYIWTPFGKAVKRILNIAIEMNDKGVYFPIWGTCLGFQALVFAISEDPLIPKFGCDCRAYNAELSFTPEGKSSRLFKQFSTAEMSDFSARGKTYNNHRYYVDYLDFLEHKQLSDFFNILAYSMDKPKTFAFISAIEAKKYPIYGTQFHPEFNPFSSALRIEGPENIKLAQDFGNFFVNECRKNANSMSSSEESKLTIFNVPVTHDPEGGFLFLFP